jgi:hypothetical protein
MPDSRIRGPSAHHMGPSPSQTATGVQLKDAPACTTGGWARAATMKKANIAPKNARLHSAARVLIVTRTRLRLHRDPGGARILSPRGGREPHRRREPECNLQIHARSKARTISPPKERRRCLGGNDSRRSFDCCGSLRYLARPDVRTLRRRKGPRKPARSQKITNASLVPPDWFRIMRLPGGEYGISRQRRRMLSRHISCRRG